MGIVESDKCQFCQQNTSHDISNSMADDFTARALFDIVSVIDPNNHFISSLSIEDYIFQSS